MRRHWVRIQEWSISRLRAKSLRVGFLFSPNLSLNIKCPLNHSLLPQHTHTTLHYSSSYTLLPSPPLHALSKLMMTWFMTRFTAVVCTEHIQTYYSESSLSLSRATILVHNSLERMLCKRREENQWRWNSVWEDHQDIIASMLLLYQAILFSMNLLFLNLCGSCTAATYTGVGSVWLWYRE